MLLPTVLFLIFHISSSAICLVFSQAAAYASSDGILTEAMIDERVEDYARQHAQKVRHVVAILSLVCFASVV